MNEKPNLIRSGNRRSFLRTGLTAAGATVGTGLLVRGTKALAQSSSGLTAGDAAILRFLAAGEALEVDFWTQCNELGGIPDSEVSGGGGNRAFTHCLRKIHKNFSQYIHDNTDDEISHQSFLNAYLASKGAQTADLEPFRTLQGSFATGSSGKLRLTNLMQLTLDTSWWTRYRSSTNNPDVNPMPFPQAVPDLHNGKFTAIPRTDADTFPEEHIQAIANTAAFQMPTVEQGGGSLRLALAQRVTSVEVLQIVISMAPIESMHFQTWHEKAGSVPPLIDPTNNLTFPNLNNGLDPNTGASGAAVREMFQTNLIMPEPCPFINASLPACSVVRPTNTTGAATGALKFLTAMGLFYRPVRCLLLVYDRSGPGRGCRPAHVATCSQAFIIRVTRGTSMTAKNDEQYCVGVANRQHGNNNGRRIGNGLYTAKTHTVGAQRRKTFRAFDSFDLILSPSGMPLQRALLALAGGILLTASLVHAQTSPQLAGSDQPGLARTQKDGAMTTLAQEKRVDTGLAPNLETNGWGKTTSSRVMVHWPVLK